MQNLLSGHKFSLVSFGLFVSCATHSSGVGGLWSFPIRIISTWQGELRSGWIWPQAVKCHVLQALFTRMCSRPRESTSKPLSSALVSAICAVKVQRFGATDPRFGLGPSPSPTIAVRVVHTVSAKWHLSDPSWPFGWTDPWWPGHFPLCPPREHEGWPLDWPGFVGFSASSE